MSNKRNFDKLRWDAKRGESSPTEWNGSYTPQQLWRKGGRNHMDIYIEVRRFPEDITKIKRWDLNNWDKQRVFEKIKETVPNAYSIEVYNQPKNSKGDDIIWKNPEWKPKFKITKLPRGNVYQGYHKGNYGN